MSIELHCHTVFSVDARGTPEELVDVAAARGVTTLSITEHDHLGSCERAQIRAAERGIEYLAGVELGAPWHDRELHLLAFGFDPDHALIQQLIGDCFSQYERHFALLEPHLREMGWHWTKQQLAAGLARRYPTHPAPVATQWYVREILVEEGVFPDLASCKTAINQVRQRVTEEHGPQALKGDVGVQRILETVHGAGGVVLLAHVAHYHRADLAKQIRLIHDVLEAGLDGFELYHPLNIAEPHFDALVSEANRLGCVISGGSDCHNAQSDGPNAIDSLQVSEQTIDRLKSVLASR